MRLIPAGIKYMQSGDIAFGLKYLPDEPASTDAVSVSLLLFQIIPKRQCCDSENNYVFLTVQIGYIQIMPVLANETVLNLEK
jgi:hypothetical protein